MPNGLVIWVCSDCLFAREGDGTESPDREPWGRMPDDDVWLGMLPEEHNDACDFHATEGELPCDEDCETNPFSWRACPACGSTLAGERQAYTVWTD